MNESPHVVPFDLRFWLGVGAILHCQVLRHQDVYRGTSLIRKRPPPRTTIGPKAYTYCRVLGWGGFSCARHPCTGNPSDEGLAKHYLSGGAMRVRAQRCDQ